MLIQLNRLFPALSKPSLQAPLSCAFTTHSPPQPQLPQLSESEPLSATCNGRKWWIGERRALFIYSRALDARNRTKPDWHDVARRLERSHIECKYNYDYMMRNWQRSKQPKGGAKTMDAGLSADDLVKLAHEASQTTTCDNDAGLEAKYGIKAGTMRFLRPLIDPLPRELVKSPDRGSGTARMWTDELVQLILDCSPLLRVPTKKDYEMVVRISGKSFKSALSVYYKHKGLYDPLLAPEFTPEEQQAIDGVCRSMPPGAPCYADVKCLLPDRPFSEIINHTLCHKNPPFVAQR